MQRRRSRPPRAPWPALLASAAVLAVAALALRSFAARDPLRRSWRATIGQAYTVRGESRVERGANTTRFHVAGVGDGTGRLTIDIAPVDIAPVDIAPVDIASVDVAPVDVAPVDIAPLGATVAADDAADGVATTADTSSDTSSDTTSDTLALAPVTATYTIDGPTVVASDGVTIPLRALGGRLPVGDPLVLLATAHAPRAGGLEFVDDRPCRRVDFVVGARAYGTWWEAHPAYLPVNANAGGLWTFEGEGTVWIDPATERPCRIAAGVRLPRLVDDSAGRGGVDWTYEWVDDPVRGMR